MLVTRTFLARPSGLHHGLLGGQGRDRLHLLGLDKLTGLLVLTTWFPTRLGICSVRSWLSHPNTEFGPAPSLLHLPTLHIGLVITKYCPAPAPHSPFALSVLEASGGQSERLKQANQDYNPNLSNVRYCFKSLPKLLSSPWFNSFPIIVVCTLSRFILSISCFQLTSAPGLPGSSLFYGQQMLPLLYRAPNSSNLYPPCSNHVASTINLFLVGLLNLAIFSHNSLSQLRAPWLNH